jgi:hypothetical protein
VGLHATRVCASGTGAGEGERQGGGAGEDLAGAVVRGVIERGMEEVREVGAEGKDEDG